MRKPPLRRIGLTALGVGCSMALSSCGLGAPGGSTATARSETVVIGARLMAETLDPLQNSNATNDFYDRPVYNALVSFASGKLSPQLAESWELAPDARSVTLKLRADVTFHSGNPLTAADVVYTLDRTKKLGSGSAAFVADYKSAAAKDEHTVVVELSRPDLAFVEALSMIYIVDSKLVSQHEGTDSGQQWLAGNDAGSGPYTLASFKPSQQVSLKRFDKYYAPLEGRPAAVEVRMIADAGAIRDELKSGGIDVGYEIAAADRQAFTDTSKYQIVRLPSPIETYVYMNTQGAVTADPRVREAIQLAYDYQGHIDNIMKGRAVLATGIVSPGVPCRVEFAPPHQDLARAKQLIEAAGATGKTLVLAYQTGPTELNMAGTSLQSSLNEIGLNVTVKNVTYPQYLQLISQPATTPDLAIAWDYPAFPAAAPMLNRAWNSAAIGQTNYTRYSNPRVDALLNGAMASTSADAACQQTQEAQRLIEQDRTVLAVSSKTVEIMADNRVTNIVDSPTGHIFDVSLLQLKK